MSAMATIAPAAAASRIAALTIGLDLRSPVSFRELCSKLVGRRSYEAKFTVSLRVQLPDPHFTCDAHHFGHSRHAPSAVAIALEMNDEVQRACDLSAHSGVRQCDASHQSERLNSSNCVGSGVG